MDELEGNAANAGIDTYATIRDAAIEWRNRTLTQGDMEDAVLLSHMIWWMTELRHVATNGSPLASDNGRCQNYQG